MNNSFSDLEFAENRDPRIAISVVLDCSDSMLNVRDGETRSPMEALNGGLDTLWTALHGDPLAKRRAEVSFVTYGSDVSEPTPFATVDNMVLPNLEPMGLTSTGAALNIALDSIEERKNVYKSEGNQYYRPILMLISDGVATDQVNEATARLAEYQQNKKLTFMPVAVEGADLNALSALGGKQALQLQGVKFDELFQWLSASAAAVSASQPGDAVAAPSPEGWAEL